MIGLNISRPSGRNSNICKIQVLYRKTRGCRYKGVINGCVLTNRLRNRRTLATKRWGVAVPGLSDLFKLRWLRRSIWASGDRLPYPLPNKASMFPWKTHALLVARSTYVHTLVKYFVCQTRHHVLQRPYALPYVLSVKWYSIVHHFRSTIRGRTARQNILLNMIPRFDGLSDCFLH